jgi:hypothetical protein
MADHIVNGYKTPAVIRPQAALNERETIETEVISTFSAVLSKLSI